MPDRLLPPAAAEARAPDRGGTGPGAGSAPTASDDDAAPRPRPDLRLVPAALAGWLAAFLALGAPPRPVLALAALAAAAGAVAALVGCRRSSARSTVLVVVGAAALCAAGAGGAAALRVAAVQSGPVPALAAARTPVEARLVLTADPVLTSGAGQPAGGRRELVRVDARVDAVAVRGDRLRTHSPVVVLAEDRAWLDLLPGQAVRTSGRLVLPRDGDIAAVLFARGPPRRDGRPPPVQRAAGELRAGLRTAVSGLPPEPRGLVPGLVVGDVSAMPPELAEDFRTTGLSHLVAVSGANCAIVLGFVLIVARWAGVRGRALPALGALALLGFVVLARPQPSVLRATVMGLVAVAALASGRRRLGIPALCAAGLGLVLADPWLARSYGFVLSVLATGALLVLAPPWTRALSRWMPRWLAAALAVPAAAQAACGPVVVLLSAQVSLAAIPANLLVAPAVPPATVLGVLAATLAPVSAPAAAVAGTLAGVPGWWIVTVARTGARLPGAAVDWPGGPGGALLLALLTVAAATLLPLLLRHRRLLRHARLSNKPRLLALAAAALVVAALPVAASRRAAWPPPGWLLVACDVGQGDALVLSAGADAAVVVDAGPDPRPVDRCLRDLGVRRIPAVVLTHLHADHVDGLSGVLRGRQVGEVVVGPVDDPPAQAARLEATLRERRLPLRRVRAGETSSVGRLSWRVLGPERVIRDGSVPNNASVVLLAERDGVRMLLPGDVEEAGQRAIRRALDVDADGAPDGGRIDLLKVPHHGSAAQDPALIALTGTGVAVVSVGADNDYGHPAPVTLAMLAASGATVLRTDRDGDVAVAGPPERLTVVGRAG